MGSRVRLVKSPLPVVANCQAGASGGVRVGVRARRGMWATPLRRASCGSPAGRVDGDGQQVVLGGGGVIGVEQNDAVGVLVLCGVYQRPDRGMRQIGDTVISADADRVTGDDHQVGVGGVGPGQPALQLGQNVAGQGVHSPQRISLRSCLLLGSGQGQITNSGHGVKVARSVWIVPLDRPAGRCSGESVHTAHAGGWAADGPGRSGTDGQVSSNKLSDSPG